MTIIYAVIAKRFKQSDREDVCLFYDESKEKAIKFMESYAKNKGFVVEEKKGVFTIDTLILREKESTGEVISEKTYREIFDIFGNRLK